MEAIVEEHLSWEQIRKKYPDEWVVLIDLDADELTHEVFGGVVFDHGKDRKNVYARIKKPLAGKSRSVLFTGDVGKGNFLF